MINFFSKYKFLFYLFNFFLILLYLFPGSLLGCFLYDDCKLQPQITADFIISTNHLYAFILFSIIGYLTFNKSSQFILLTFYLILVRHGQSIWNLEKKFTGWVDVDLTENGKSEAKKAGQLIKHENIEINLYYSSFQLRAKNTLKIIQEELSDFKDVKSAWELNERHYGALTGLNKDEMKKKLGEEKVHQFRRSWDLRPDPLDKKNPYHPLNIETYKEIPLENIPNTESLKDTYERVIKFYSKEIENKTSENILISAHGNSIRALCKYLFNLDNNVISKLEIPTGNPLLIELENGKIFNCKYLDQERAKDLLVF